MLLYCKILEILSSFRLLNKLNYNKVEMKKSLLQSMNTIFIEKYNKKFHSILFD
jgi:hypothetical protein